MNEKTMISPYDLYGTDPALETNGVWVDVGPMSFLLARAGGENQDFKTMVAKKFAPFQVAIANDMLPETAAKSMLVEVFAETIIKDWKNVGARDGSELPFTKDNAKTLLNDLPELLMTLQAEANKLGNYKKRQLEAAAKN